MVWLPTGATLREFQRLEREAQEVAYTHDEYCQLVFNAAVKLASGEWTVDQTKSPYGRHSERADDWLDALNNK